ncbi:hypothetical protein [Paenibacillus sp. Z6-24]
MTTTKKAVQLPVLERSRRNYDRLRTCRRCGKYTILPGEACPSCGRARLVPVMERARSRARRKMLNEILFTVLLIIIAILLAQDMTQIAIAAGTGLILLALLVLVQRRMTERETLRQLSRMFRYDHATIHDGLVHDQSTGVETVRSGKDVEGYHILRQTAVLVRNDRLRLALLSLLQNFRLRSDMDLELESLITRDFDPLVADYIGEIARLKRDMIKDRAIRYIIANEPRILEMENGWNILISVASAAVRMKRYVTMYQGFIRRYARFLPRERFVRLYHVVHSDPALQSEVLGQDMESIRAELYPSDPAFEPDAAGAERP